MSGNKNIWQIVEKLSYTRWIEFKKYIHIPHKIDIDISKLLQYSLCNTYRKISKSPMAMHH